MIQPSAAGCDDHAPDSGEDALEISDEDLDRGLRFAFETEDDSAPSRLLHQPAGTLSVASAGRFSLDDLNHDTANLAAGRYSLGSELGRGGVGAVFEAQDVELGRELALKVLLEDHRNSPSMTRRFVEEAQISGQLQHPGIVPVHQLGTLDDGRLFFSMKLVRGQTLEDLLASRPEAETDRQHYLGIFRRICQTVAYAHSRRVIHRDLKPANVMVGAFGEVQVLDWGLAKVLGRSDDEATEAASEEAEVETLRSMQPANASMPGSVMGTPSYMSPEQARGEIHRIDERADVFGLGAILCEIIVARPPYEGKTSVEVRERAARGDVQTAVATIDRCAADPEVRALAKRCLSADPDDRPRTAGEVAEEINRYLDSLEERARRSELDAAEARVKAQEERRARRLTLGIGTLAVVLIVGGAWAVVERMQRRSDAEGAMLSTLAEADDLLATGLSARDLTRLQRGRDLAQHALSLADNAPVGDAIVSRATATLTQMERAIELSDRVRELNSIRIEHGDDPRWEAREPQYSALFTAVGIPVDTLDEAEAIRRIRESEIGAELTAALDDWARFRRRAQPAGDGWRRLSRIAGGAVDDGTSRLRRAFLEEDHATLRRLAVTDTPQRADAAVLLGATLLEIDEVDLARVVFARARIAFPDDYWVQHGSGAVELRSDPPREQEARIYYEAALALRPNSVHARLDLARRYLNLGQTDRAVAYYREALRIEPSRDQVRLFLADVLRQSKNYESAEVLYREATTGLYALEAWTTLGTMLREAEDATGARQAVDRALELDPAHVKARLQLALLHADGKEIDRAVEIVDELIAAGNVSADLYHKLAYIEWERKSYDVAISAMNRSIELDPTIARAYLSRGELRQENGELRAAKVEYERALELDSTLARAWYKLGDVRYRLDQPDWLAAFARAIEIGGLSFSARKGVLRATMRAGIRKHEAGAVYEALPLLRFARKFDPYQFGFREAVVRRIAYSYAHSLQLTGDTEAAVPVYSELAAMDTKVDETLIFSILHLGQCLEAVGRDEEAVAQFARGAELCRLTQSARTADAERWEAEARVAVEVAAKMTEYDAGAWQPTHEDEILAVARFEQSRDRPAAAAEMYRRWFTTTKAKSETQRVRRYLAAVSALEASVDATLKDTEQREWRGRALADLRSILASLSEQPEDPMARRLALGRWLRDDDFALVRVPARLAELPRDERGQWFELWRDHAELLP